jgi:hypothetical protein
LLRRAAGKGGLKLGHPPEQGHLGGGLDAYGRL